MSPKDDIPSSASEPTDEQLMAAFQAGDRAAFTTIDHRHRPGTGSTDFHPIAGILFFAHILGGH